jgi:hypothetical protein
MQTTPPARAPRSRSRTPPVERIGCDDQARPFETDVVAHLVRLAVGVHAAEGERRQIGEAQERVLALQRLDRLVRGHQMQVAQGRHVHEELAPSRLLPHAR